VNPTKDPRNGYSNVMAEPAISPATTPPAKVPLTSMSSSLLLLKLLWWWLFVFVVVFVVASSTVSQQMITTGIPRH
jgi:hypothetical protein